MDKVVVPKIIDVKIGSKTEAKWTETFNRMEDRLIVEEINRKIAIIQEKADKEILELTKEEIAKEKEKYK